MKKLNILKYLERNDKWYLGGGNRLIWTPPFPIWLEYPGFWDKAHYYNYEIEPVFTWTVLDEDGVEIPLRGVERKWDPSKLKTRYQISDVGYQSPRSEIRNPKSNLSMIEEKSCLPNDVLTSVVSIKNTLSKPRKLHFVAWTIQPSYPGTTWLSDIEFEKNRINFKKHLHRFNAPILPVHCSFGLNRKVNSYSINLSEGPTIQPHWRFTPFVEKFRDGKFRDEVRITGVNGDGLIFIALHASVELGAKKEEQIAAFFAAAPTKKEVKKNLSVAFLHDDPVKVSENKWNDYFAGVPYFQCSDEYITRYYWYRWYGLKLLTLDGNQGNYKHPVVCEGTGYFRAPISYSATCHMLENRWLRDPRLAQGSLLTFIDNQRKDGGFRGYIDPNYYRPEMFYHSNWGNAVRELHRIHPDGIFLRRAYDGLVKYVRYFDRERDKEGSGLYNIENQYETGQEYMHRYLAVDEDADKDNWGKIFRLKGVDVSVYIYELKKTLAWMAEEIHRRDAEVAKWSLGADKIKHAVLEKMWDPEQEMFFDVNPKTGKRTNVKAAVCFYPYLTDIVSKIHVSGLKRHLLNRKEFWTPFPVPSSSLDDKYFSAEPEWKGKRMNCPWNGRVWPMINSHMIELLAQTAIRFNDTRLRAKSVELMGKFIRMMFFDGNPKSPNCFEHYNPITGEPSSYRGVDDYQHSWVNDLIIKYVAGIHMLDDAIFVEPFNFGLRDFVIKNLHIGNHRLSIELKHDIFSVWSDGKRKGKEQLGRIVKIPF